MESDPKAIIERLRGECASRCQSGGRTLTLRIVTATPPSPDSGRTAEDTVRGFVTQMYWTIDRWLDLRVEERLVCEGHEDVDRWLRDADGRFVSSVREQMKDIRSGRISVRTAQVHETIFNFLLSFVDSHARQESVRFVFTTSARFAQQRLSSHMGEDGALSIDVLREWRDLHDSEKASESVASLRDAVETVIRHYGAEERIDGDSRPPPRHARSKLLQALSYMEEHGVWEGFLRSVEWRPEALVDEELLLYLENRIQTDLRANGLPPRLLLPRLLAIVLHTCSSKDVEQRALGPADLDAVFSETEDRLREWSRNHRGHLVSSWLSELQVDVNELREEVAHLVSGLITNRLQATESIELLAAGLRAAAREDDSELGFIGFPPDIESKPRVERSRVFVAPVFTRDNQTGKVLELDELEALCLGQEVPAYRAVILGDLGGGKSTLCRMLALRTAQRETGPVPLLLNVRELDENDVKLSALGMVAGQLSRRRSKAVEHEMLAQLCERGETVLLIDGLDELADELRDQFRGRLHGFARSYAKTPIIVTARPAGYDRSPLNARFEVIHLEPFDVDRLRVFIERWFEVAIPDDPDERSRVRGKLNAALDAQPNSRALARNPLLATLIALVYHENRDLPTQRVELYRLCIEILVRDWPEKGNRAMPELPGDLQIQRLGVLALWMQEARSSSNDTGGILVDRSLLDDNLARLLARSVDPGPVQQQKAAAARWRRWLADSMVLQEPQRGLYGFVHLWLMEYLAARRLLEKLSDIQRISDHVAKWRIKTSWHETLLLMLGIRANDGSLCSKVVERLLIEGRTREDARFLLSLLREDLDIDKALRQQLLSSVATFVGDHSFSTRPRHNAYDSLVSDIIESSRRHGEAVRSWIIDEAGQCNGGALVGILLMAPVSLEPALRRRALEPQDMVRLLELGEKERWGRWAVTSAKPTDLLCWTTSAPVNHLLGHALRAGTIRKDAAASWVLGVLRRLTWLSVTMSTLRQNADISEAMEWDSGGVRLTIASWPAVVSGLGDLRDPAAWMKESIRPRDISEGDAALEAVVKIQVASSDRLLRRFARFIQGSHVSANVGNLFDMGRETAALDRNAEFLAFARYCRVVDDHPVGSPLGLGPSVLPARTPPDLRPTPPWFSDVEKADGHAIATAVFASFHAGMLTAGDEFGHVTGTMFVQNLWLNVFFDPLVEYVAREVGATPTTLAPEHYALLLALGLAQYQTTWHWPFSKHWHQWFSVRTPPEHWLAAYIWHLCWAVGESGDSTHLKHAEACLSHSDWPDLAAALRKLAIVPASEGPLARE